MRARVAERAATPWWYPPAYGVGTGGLVASLALPDRHVLFGVAASLALLVGAYTVWRRRSGLAVSGLRPGRTRTIAVGMGSVSMLAAILAVYLRDRWPNGSGPLLCGGVLALAASYASISWDRAWRAELAGPLE
jgi:hypothetical protein